MLCYHYLLQYVEYRINKGALGLGKEVNHQVLEYQGPAAMPGTSRVFHDIQQHLQVPPVPPTLTGVCKLLEIYYVLKVSRSCDMSLFLSDLVTPL